VPVPVASRPAVGNAAHTADAASSPAADAAAVESDEKGACSTAKACGPLGPSGEEAAWAAQCRFQPGDGPLTFSVQMAKAGLGDSGMRRWCTWMGRRLQQAKAAPIGADQPGPAAVRAPLLDFSSNCLGAAGVRALCSLLEGHSVRCAVVKLADNAIDDAAVRELARYLASCSQAPILELHLSHNRISVRGLLWLLACLALHPAYPVHDRVRHAYVPIWLRVEHNAMASCEVAALLSAALAPLHITACRGVSKQECGTVRCAWMRAKGALKHNCVAHLPQCLLQAGPRAGFPAMPRPELHAAPIYSCTQRSVPWPGAEEAGKPETAQRQEPLVLYEDADTAVLMKPSGWICSPVAVDSAAAALPPQQRREAVARLQAQAAPAPLPQYLVLRYGASSPICCDPSRQFGLVHRLDLETSGPVLIGKTPSGFEAARAQLRERDVIKDYVALVHGSLGVQRCGEVRGPIDDSTYAAHAVCRVHSSGRDAITVYESVGEYFDATETYTLVHLRLITGRMHQARIHMACLGHPLVADSRYASSSTVLERDRSFCPRLFLHKVRLGFFTTVGEPVVVWSSLAMAPELLSALARLQAAGS